MVSRQIWVSGDFDLWLRDVKRKNPEFNNVIITKLLSDNMKRNQTDFLITPFGFSKKRRVKSKKKEGEPFAFGC